MSTNTATCHRRQPCPMSELSTVSLASSSASLSSLLLSWPAGQRSCWRSASSSVSCSSAPRRWGSAQSMPCSGYPASRGTPPGAAEMVRPNIPFEVEPELEPEVVPFFDPATNTISYVVHDPDSTACAVIDSVMDFDYASGRISFEHADAIIAFIRERNWLVEWLIETHAHADHLSAAPYIQRQLGGKLGIGENIR